MGAPWTNQMLRSAKHGQNWTVNDLSHSFDFLYWSEVQGNNFGA